MESHGGGHYRRLLVMTILSFIAMYVLMYAMVNRITNVYPNFNQFYMAGLMTAAMIVIELLVMGGMYPNKRVRPGSDPGCRDPEALPRHHARTAAGN